MHTPRERLIRYLDDAWAVEKAQVAALDLAADKLHANGLWTMLKEQRQTAATQEENLEAKIRAFGQEPTASKRSLSKVLAKISEGLHDADDEYDTATQTVFKEYAALHFKRAMYEALRAYAQVVGETEIANVAARYADLALRAAERMWQQVEPTATRAAEQAMQGASEATTASSAGSVPVPGAMSNGGIL